MPIDFCSHRSGGLNTTGSAYFFTYYEKDRTEIVPWDGDFAFTGTSSADGDLNIGGSDGTGGTVVFETENEKSEPCNITINAKIFCREAVKDGSRIEMTGSGKVQWNSASRFYGNVFVRDTATLAFGSAEATIGRGAIRFAPNTTLALPPAGNGAVSIETVSFIGDGKVNICLGDGGEIADGAYELISLKGSYPSDFTERFTLVNETVGNAKFVVKGTGILMLIVGNVVPEVSEYIWTGAENNKMSNGANWLGGKAPLSGGEAVFFPIGEGIIENDIDSFAPASITFGSGISDGLTISGREITVGSSITNLSKTANAVFSSYVKVISSDPYLQVCQSADYSNYLEISQGLKGLIVFEGGVESEKAIEYSGSNTSAPYNIYAGHYVRKAESDYTSNLDTKWRQIIVPDSSLCVNSAGNTMYMFIAKGGAFTTEVANASARLVVGSQGEYVVKGMLTHNSSDEMNLCYCGDATWAKYNDGGILKARGVTINGGGPVGLNGTGSYPSTNHWYIGEKGMNTTKGDSAFFFTRNVADRAYIHPWMCDFSINGGRKDGPDIYIGAGLQLGGTIVLVTDDENGVPRTITVNGKIGCREAIKDSCGLEIEGRGSIVWNSSSSFFGMMKIKDTATLIVNPGASIGAGEVYVYSGATLAFTNTAAEVSVSNPYKFSSGAVLSFAVAGNGKSAKAKFNSSIQSSGPICIDISDVSQNTGKWVEPYFIAEGLNNLSDSDFYFASMPTWVDARKPLTVQDGKLYLNVKKPGFLLKVK